MPWYLLFIGIVPLVIRMLSARRAASIGRSGFLIRFVAIWGSLSCVAFTGLLFAMFTTDEIKQQLQYADVNVLILGVGILILVVLPFLLGRWSSLRLADIGWSRWLVVLFYVPLANVPLLIVLCVKHGKPHDAEAANAAS